MTQQSPIILPDFYRIANVIIARRFVSFPLYAFVVRAGYKTQTAISSNNRIWNLYL